MKKLLLVSSLFIATFASNVYAAGDAGLFVEPMVTWERGRGDVNFPSPISSADTELDGFGIGTRLGVHVLESFFIGADGRYSIPKFKDNKINQDADAKAWNVGPVFGVQMPTLLGLRVWAGWIMAGGVDVDKSKNVDEEFKSGSGYRVGAGIKLGYVSLNAEYQKMKYDETVLQEVGVFNPGTTYSNVELNNDSMILSVSFPLAI